MSMNCQQNANVENAIVIIHYHYDLFIYSRSSPHPGKKQTKNDSN